HRASRRGRGGCLHDGLPICAHVGVAAQDSVMSVQDAKRVSVLEAKSTANPQHVKETLVSIVVINALSVPEGQGSELEARFAARKHAVDQSPGFEGFNLLRPTGDNTQ